MEAAVLQRVGYLQGLTSIRTLFLAVGTVDLGLKKRAKWDSGGLSHSEWPFVCVCVCVNYLYW